MNGRDVARLGVPLALLALLAGCPGACSGGMDGAGATPGTSGVSPGQVIYTDITRAAGIRFLHRHGGTGEKYLPETVCGGVLAFDYDNDGDIDLYFIQGGKLPHRAGQETRNVLYRNDGKGRFEDDSGPSGLADDGYGMGGAAADIDNDGDLDLYVTNYGPNRLYGNNGDGTFADITERAGVGDPRWGASVSFGDHDGDGLVDLYVTNYLDYTLATHHRCGKKLPGFETYCHPDEYPGIDDVYYKNRGDGVFEDVTRKVLPGPLDPGATRKWLSGKMNGKGLGVVSTDYDLDGDLDIYVANDSTRNYLLKNRGDGTFLHEISAGVGLNDLGKTEASMGLDAGDIDGDGWFDLFTVHMDGETNTLYINGQDGTFSDETIRSGLGRPSLPFVGFGANLFDYDNDGDLDIFIANGHITDNIKLYSADREYEQTDFLFRNDGTGRFEEIGQTSGDYFRRKFVGRGSAVADFDEDGDLDLVICNNNGPAFLLRNDGGNRNHFILIRTIGTRSNRDGIGALLRVTAGGKTQVGEVRCGTSYLAQSDLRVHFGLGDAKKVDKLEVRWPSGVKETFTDLPVDRIITLKESSGVVARR